MNALSFDTDVPRPSATAPVHLAPPPVLAVPAELLALFEESLKVKTSFWRLEDRDRSGFIRYIEEAKTPTTRERRATIVAMSLFGLARDIRDENVARLG